MFIPYGLGFGPQKFPIITLLLVLANIMISSQMFDATNNFEQEVAEIEKEYELQKKLFKVMNEACPRIESQEFCKVINGLIEKQSKEKTKLNFELKDVTYYYKLSVKAIEYLEKFSGDKVPEEALGLESYLEYKSLKTKLQKKTDKIAQKYGLTTKSNANFFNLIKASFTHIGYMHLIGNLFFIIIFGIYVEQRLGSLLYLAVFLTGSVMGLYLHLVFSESTSAIMGSSAGATCLIGAFIILFWHMKMKFYFTFTLFDYTPFFFSVPIVVPVFYLANDFVMILIGANSQIAHFAHAVGASFGIVFALAYQRIKPIEKPFAFEQEQDLYQEIRRTGDFHKNFKKYLEAFKWNSQNTLLLDSFLQDLKTSNVGLNKLEERISLQWIMNSYYSLYKSHEKKYEILDIVVSFYDLNRLLKKEKWQNLVQIADMALDKKKYHLALNLYRYSLRKMKGPKRIEVQKTCNNIQNYLNPKEEIDGSSTRS